MMGHTADGYLLGEGRIRARRNQYPLCKKRKTCGDSSARSLGRRGHTSWLTFLNPKFPLCIPGMAVDLSAEQLLSPTQTSFLCGSFWSLPGGWSGPLFHPTGWAPPHLSAQFPAAHSLPAKEKKPGFERLNSSRGARRLPPSRRFKSQSLGVASNETCLLKVRSFPAHAPNVVATLSGKQTHSEGQCS